MSFPILRAHLLLQEGASARNLGPTSNVRFVPYAVDKEISNPPKPATLCPLFLFSYLLWTFWRVSASSVLLWCLNSTSLEAASAARVTTPAMKTAHRVNMRNIWEKRIGKESPLSVALGGRSTNEWKKKQDRIRGERERKGRPTSRWWRGNAGTTAPMTLDGKSGITFHVSPAYF